MLPFESMDPAASGRQKIDWVAAHMPVLAALEQTFAEEKPFAGRRLSLSIHLEAKTARLALLLRAGGAEVAATGCNPLSTQDDVAAGLASLGVSVYAAHGATPGQYEEHLKQTISFHPHLVLDDGGDLTALLHGDARAWGDALLGITEETTTGVARLRARLASGQLLYPTLAVNDAQCKHLFDNRYGTGQSTWEGILHTTNVQVSGKTVVVAGYGWCGRGVAMRAQGLGARVIVTEVDPVKAIEADCDGFSVMTMDEAAPLGDIFITVTGCEKVITARHMERMKNEALLANAGHFDVEIDKDDLDRLSVDIRPRRKNITGYRMGDGRTLNLLAEGRLVNLAAGLGHPAEIMDMSFAVQALCLRHLAIHGASLAPGVYDVPPAIDEQVARLKLAARGLSIDRLTPDQDAYLRQF